MPRPAADDLFACLMEPDEPDGETSFRIVEVVSARAQGLDVIVYGDSFASPPAEVDVRRLRRVRLHELLGGPAPAVGGVRHMGRDAGPPCRPGSGVTRAVAASLSRDA